MAVSTGAALLGGAVIGGLVSSQASGQASGAVRDAARESADVQRYMYDTTRADLAPYRGVGVNALNRLAGMYGLGGGGGIQDKSLRGYLGMGQPQGAGFSDFYASPDYQFRVGEGINALDRSAAARGRLFSGAQMRGITEFGQAAGAQEFGNYYNRLAGLAGVGQSATAQTGTAGANMASGVSNALMQGGQARASGYLGQANALNNLIGQGAMLYGMGAFG